MAYNAGDIFYTLPNPFQVDSTSAIIGHVSGRYADISEIIRGKQSAIILAGAPRIGKSTLVRYLQRKTCDSWSWRDEVAGPDNASELQSIHFVQVNLTALEDKTTPIEQHDAFVKACIQALKPVIPEVGTIPIEQANMNSLKAALRQAADRAPDARYFVILDAIDRLGKADISAFIASEPGDSSQNHGLALLDSCKAIGVLVNLLDEFESFGVSWSSRAFLAPGSIISFPRSRQISRSFSPASKR
jgi:hypothetical protein